MKKFLCLLAFAAASATPLLAQQMPKIEVSLDGAFNRFDTPPGYYLNMPGGALAGNYTVFRWLSGKVELSGEYGTRALVGSTLTANALAGPQFFPLHHHKITPWGEFLFGEGYYRNMIPAFGGFPSQTISSRSFTYEGGLGLDWRLKSHWDIRPIEFDYLSSKFLATAPNQIRQGKYRIQVGIVYRIGTGKSKHFHL
jgi:hypothetical protein